MPLKFELFLGCKEKEVVPERDSSAHRDMHLSLILHRVQKSRWTGRTGSHLTEIRTISTRRIDTSPYLEKRSNTLHSIWEESFATCFTVLRLYSPARTKENNKQAEAKLWMSLLKFQPITSHIKSQKCYRLGKLDRTFCFAVLCMFQVFSKLAQVSCPMPERNSEPNRLQDIFHNGSRIR